MNPTRTQVPILSKHVPRVLDVDQLDEKESFPFILLKWLKTFLPDATAAM
jgi:hypothetical protein